MKNRFIWIVLIIILLLVLTFWKIFIYKSEIIPKGNVIVYLHLYSDTLKLNINSMLDEFNSFYPEIKITTIIKPYQDMRRILEADLKSPSADHVIVSVLSGQDLEKLKADHNSSPWISYVWKLYYNKNRLNDIGYDEESLNSLSNLGMDSFIADFEDKLSEGESLYALGTKFYLPWIMWLQHLQLMADNGKMPGGYNVSEWEKGLESWETLQESGHFDKNYHDMNMAYSQIAITEGDSLFVLSDSSIFSTYSPAGRSELGAIPFPGSVSQGWEVGSNFYLEMFAAEDSPESSILSAELIIDYLRSEGVSQRFLKQTGILLLPDKERSGIKEIPAMTHHSMELEIQDLLRYLD